MQKIASLSINATTLDEIGLTEFRFIFYVCALTLPQLIYSVSKLASLGVFTISIVQKISAQFVLELFIRLGGPMFRKQLLIRIRSRCRSGTEHCLAFFF
jgi:hypothetical protein